MSRFIVDFDDHLVSKTDWKPIQDEINETNKMFDLGHQVIIHTSRHWKDYDAVKGMLKRFGIKHNELVMGKPLGIYVDKDSYKSIKEYRQKQ